MSRPTLEVADIVRIRQQLPRSTRIASRPAAPQGDGRYRPLPHGGARRSSRPLLRLRTPGHLVQLLPQPALSQVPVERTRSMAGRAFGRAVARALLPYRLHAAA